MLRSDALGAIHLLGEQRRREVTAVREVPVQRRLTDAGASGDLVHRDVRGLGEQLPGGGEDRVVVALGVFAPRDRG
jgi:hypothetical protein